MFENRLSDLFERRSQQIANIDVVTPAPVQPLFQLVTLRDVYQAAAARALRDFEFDRLFNADYYNDHGSGI